VLQAVFLAHRPITLAVVVAEQFHLELLAQAAQAVVEMVIKLALRLEVQAQ
jgi:hypothetical protein